MKKPTGLSVAMIEPVGGHGGMDYYDFGLCGGLVQANVDVRYYTCDETVIPAEASYVIHRWYKGIYGKRSVFLRGLRFLFATFRVFVDVLLAHIRIVHFHFFDVGVVQLGQIVLAKLLMRKVVVTVHDVEGFVEGKGSTRMAKIAYRLADRLIVHNQFCRDELAANMLVAVKDISVIPHGNYRHMYPNLIARGTARAQLGIEDGEKVLLFFGQIKGVKRLDLLLSAFAEVLKTQPNTRLLIAGKVVDIPFSEYQARIDKLGIAENCTCLIRYIRNDEVPVFYAASDLVVLPYERIYQSGVLLMAMSFSRAVVVSDIPGMLEIVHDGETGYVFRNGDASDLTSVLLNSLADDVKRITIEKNSLQVMDDIYDWKRIGKMTADFYAGILQGNTN